MGSCNSMPPMNPPLYATHPNYVAAGILFTDMSTALAGTQQHMSPPSISGFGGKRDNKDADWFDTAWRETVEELLGWDTVPAALLRSFRTHLKMEHVSETSSYVVARCSFDTLIQFLRLCSGSVSPFYAQHPQTLLDLILTRNPTAEGEIGGLALLPVAPSPCLVDRLFQGDLKKLRAPSPPQSVRLLQSGAAPSRAPCSMP